MTLLPPAPAAAVTVHKILCLGESTTAPTAPPDHSWPRQLEELLNREHPGKFVVLNHLPEAGFADIEKALPAYLDRYEPRMLVAMMGIGDPDWPGAGPSSRTGRLIHAVRSRGLPLVLMQYPGLDAARLPRALAKSPGIAIVDNKRSFAKAVSSGRYEDYFQDRSFGAWGHATAKGNRLIAENAAREISRLLREPRAAKASHAQLLDAYRRITRSHRELDDEAGARGALGRLLELQPDDGDALRLMAEISLDDDLPWDALHYADLAGAERLAGEIRLLLGDHSGAAENLKRAALQDPRDAELPLLLAQAKRDRPDDALSHARQSARAGGGAAAHLYAGNLQIDLGDKKGAEASLTQALASAPDDLDALHAIVRLKRGRKKEAFAYAVRAETAAGKAPLWLRQDAYRYSARIWIEIGEHARAGENLVRALTSNPDDYDALLTLVRIKARLPQKTIARAHLGAGPIEPEPGPAAASEDELDRALGKNGHDLEALRRLVELSRDLGRFPRASVLARRFQRSVAKAPLWQREAAYRLGARLWLDLGREAPAFQSLSRALEVNPDSIAARRAIIGLRRPQEEDSVLDSADIGGFANRYVRAAAMRVELGDRDGALASIQRALDLSPGDIGALQLRSRLKRAD